MNANIKKHACIRSHSLLRLGTFPFNWSPAFLFYKLLFLGHRSLIKKITQTVVINIVFQRIFFIELDVSHGSLHTLSKVTVIAELRSSQHGGHTPNRLRDTDYFFDTGHPCYDQLTPVKTRYPLTSITLPYRGLKFTARRSHMFLWSWRVSMCWFSDWIVGSCQVNSLKTGQDCSKARLRNKS